MAKRHHDSPMFVVAKPHAFYELTLAQNVDPGNWKNKSRCIRALLRDTS
jgi:hypothetical protein